MLLRRVGKEKVATLKRSPLPEELDRFDTSIYPKTRAEFKKEDWKNDLLAAARPRIGDLIQSVDTRGDSLIDRLFKVCLEFRA